jgi:hypothetical protein
MAHFPSDAPPRASSYSNAAGSRMGKCLGNLHARSESLGLGHLRAFRYLALRPGDALLHTVCGDTKGVELCIKMVAVSPQIVSSPGHPAQTLEIH